MSLERDIELLYEIGSLRHVPRGWRQHLGMDCSSDLEHTYRVIYLALMLARMEGGCDENKIFRMALVHDIPETRVSDHSYVQKAYVTNIDEEKAAKDMFDRTSLEDFYETFVSFEDRGSLEAKIVKDADNLDIDIELKELEEQGSQVPRKWAKNRRMVRDEKLYTESAKKVWDAIEASDPSSWHLAMNKWKTDPTAGK